MARENRTNGKSAVEKLRLLLFEKTYSEWTGSTRSDYMKRPLLCSPIGTGCDDCSWCVAVHGTPAKGMLMIVIGTGRGDLAAVYISSAGYSRRLSGNHELAIVQAFYREHLAGRTQELAIS